MGFINELIGESSSWNVAGNRRKGQIGIISKAQMNPEGNKAELVYLLNVSLVCSKGKSPWKPKHDNGDC